MKEKVEKCPMCGFPVEEDCDLMVGKGVDKTPICCCDRLQKKSVKKQ
jgi:hypothetical protein